MMSGKVIGENTGMDMEDVNAVLLYVHKHMQAIVKVAEDLFKNNHEGHSLPLFEACGILSEWLAACVDEEQPRAAALLAAAAVWFNAQEPEKAVTLCDKGLASADELKKSEIGRQVLAHLTELRMTAMVMVAVRRAGENGPTEDGGAVQ